MPQNLALYRSEIAAMAVDLFDVIGIPFEQTTELQRQVLSAFAFGMIFAEGRIKRLSPPDVHALTVCCLTDVFRYADHQAAAFSARLVSSASGTDPKDKMKAIIHRGIDGHRQWQQHELEPLKANIEGIFKALGA